MTDIISKQELAQALVRARQACAADPELGKLFVEPPSAEWLADNLSVRLSARWGGRDFGLAWEVSLHLADEFFKTREAPVLVTDRTTGETIASLPADAIWTPDPVVRESGNLVRPSPRLRPEIEAELVLRQHDQAREQMALRRDEYARHPNKDILTHTGRQTMAEKAYAAATGLLRETLPMKLPVNLGRGQHDKVLVAHSSLRMPDLHTMNLAFSFEMWLTQSLAQKWRQAVAALVVETAEWAVDDMPMDFWIGAPEQVLWASQKGPAGQFIWGETLIGVSGVAFAVDIQDHAPNPSQLMCVEMNGSWRVEAALPVRVTRLDGSIWRYNAPVDQAHHTEVVR
jgi:hypothetical protein